MKRVNTMSDKNRNENILPKYYDVYKYRKLCDLITVEFYKGLNELEEYVPSAPLVVNKLLSCKVLYSLINPKTLL